MLSHTASNQKLDQLEEQEPKDIQKLSRKIAELKKVLKAAKARTLRCGADVREEGHGTKRGTAETGITGCA